MMLSNTLHTYGYPLSCRHTLAGNLYCRQICSGLKHLLSAQRRTTVRAACGQSRQASVRACRLASTCLQTALLPSGPAKCRTDSRIAAAAVAEASVLNGAGHEVLSVTKYDDVGLTIEVSVDHGQYKVDLTAEPPRPMLLHWGVNEWESAPEYARPAGTVQVDDKAVQTPFEDGQHLQLSFPEEHCPNRVVFVLKETQPEHWISNGGDFTAYLKPPSVEDVLAKVLTAEATYTNWSLFNRMCMAIEILDAADAAGPEGMAFMAVWLRLSANKQLDWYRNSNYQSKDIAHVQKVIAQRMADKCHSSMEPWNRVFARLCLAGMPRGGGDGDAIRMGVLNIMRANGIREGHRPGIEDHFLEQWHQKLHTNTTPEDITICEAYLAFLHSGSMDDFWRVAWDNGKITRESLAAMDHPITGYPVHLPHMIGAFEHYLWVLKTTHSGADMDTAFNMARGSLDDETAWMTGDLLQHRNEWWVPGKIVDVRRRLEPVWRREGASRDVLLLDIALESYFRVLIERQEKSSLQGDSLVDLVALVLQNSVIAAESLELGQVLAQWERVSSGERWSQGWALQALAAADRAQLALSAYMDSIYALVQPRAEQFRDACGINQAYIANFGEEVVRGQPSFVLSILLRWLAPMLRAAAGVGSWQVVSQAAAAGEVLVLPGLAEVQGERYDSPTVVVATELGGMEDIPEGITAVLTGSATDVLSHVAIRARSQGVLLATCFDQEELAAISALAGQPVQLSVTPAGAVVAAVQDAGQAAVAGGAALNGSLPRLSIPKPKPTSRWALPEAEFSAGLVGGKSGNLATLRSKLPDWISVPASIALPFASFERVLADPLNKALAAQVAKALKQLAAHKGAGVPAALAELRALVGGGALQAPPQLVVEAAAAAGAAGLVPQGAWAASSPAWSSAWAGICRVWASKFTDRAWLSRRARSVPDDALFMAALIQQVVPAEYAFVVHTADPLTGERGQIFGEVVVGMGEALVGNFPGRALTFTAPSKGEGEITLVALPSKRLGLFVDDPTLIVRSDSNGEDLEAFAGAGLYDSIPLLPLAERIVDYAANPLMWDAEFRTKVLSGIAEVARAVEAAFDGVPQDIEGVYADGKFTVVQSRPQVV